MSAVAVHGRLAAGGGERISHCSAAPMSTKAAPAAAGVTGVDRTVGKGLGSEDIMVYQYKICPFCNKLKAIMDYFGVPYEVTEVCSKKHCFSTL